MVVRTREQAALKGLQVVISPRATLGGIKLLRSGVPWDTAVRVTLRKTMKASDWDKIMEFTDEAGAAREAGGSATRGQAGLRLGLQARAAPAKKRNVVIPSREPTPWKEQKSYFKVNLMAKPTASFTTIYYESWVLYEITIPNAIYEGAELAWLWWYF